MTTSMSARTDVEVTDEDVKKLPAVQQALERLATRGLKVTGIEVHYQVPGGGDWSGMNAPVDQEHPVSIVITSQGTFEDTTK